MQDLCPTIDHVLEIYIHSSALILHTKALEPSISKQIMELHHSKHHQTYVTNLNAALKSQAEAVKSNDVPQQVALLQAIRFNGGGHINHSLFWQNLISAASSDRGAAPQLSKAIQQHWGMEAFPRNRSD